MLTSTGESRISKMMALPMFTKVLMLVPVSSSKTAGFKREEDRRIQISCAKIMHEYDRL